MVICSGSLGYSPLNSEHQVFIRGRRKEGIGRKRKTYREREGRMRREQERKGEGKRGET